MGDLDGDNDIGVFFKEEFFIGQMIFHDIEKFFLIFNK